MANMLDYFKDIGVKTLKDTSKENLNKLLDAFGGKREEKIQKAQTEYNIEDFLIPHKDDIPLKEVPGRALKNLPVNFLSTTAEGINALTSPLETVSTIGKAFAGGIQRPLDLILPHQAGTRLFGGDYRKFSDALNADILENYGSVSGIKKRLANEPFEALLDFSSPMSSFKLPRRVIREKTARDNRYHNPAYHENPKTFKEGKEELQGAFKGRDKSQIALGALEELDKRLEKPFMEWKEFYKGNTSRRPEYKADTPYPISGRREKDKRNLAEQAASWLFRGTGNVTEEALGHLLGWTTGAGPQAVKFSVEAGKKGGDKGNTFRRAMAGYPDAGLNEAVIKGNKYIRELKNENTINMEDLSIQARDRTLKGTEFDTPQERADWTDLDRFEAERVSGELSDLIDRDLSGRDGSILGIEEYRLPENSSLKYYINNRRQENDDIARLQVEKEEALDDVRARNLPDRDEADAFAEIDKEYKQRIDEVKENYYNERSNELSDFQNLENIRRELQSMLLHYRQTQRTQPDLRTNERIRNLENLQGNIKEIVTRNLPDDLKGIYVQRLRTQELNDRDIASLEERFLLGSRDKGENIRSMERMQTMSRERDLFDRKEPGSQNITEGASSEYIKNLLGKDKRGEEILAHIFGNEFRRLTPASAVRRFGFLHPSNVLKAFGGPASSPWVVGRTGYAYGKYAPSAEWLARQLVGKGADIGNIGQKVEDLKARVNEGRTEYNNFLPRDYLIKKLGL